jgi:hypothetical protein
MNVLCRYILECPHEIWAYWEVALTCGGHRVAHLPTLEMLPFLTASLKHAITGCVCRWSLLFVQDPYWMVRWLGRDGQLAYVSWLTLCPKVIADSFGGPVWCLAANRDGDVLAAGCEDGCVRLFDIMDGGLSFMRAFDKQVWRSTAVLYVCACMGIAHFARMGPMARRRASCRWRGTKGARSSSRARRTARS